MIAAVGVGLGAVFVAYPALKTILKYAGAAYLIYLAAGIAMSGATSPDQDNRRGPMTFWGAAMFQWVNVKGWVMVIGTITAYAAIAAFPWNIAIQIGICLVAGHLAPPTWALFGSSLRPILTSPGGARLQHRDGAAAAGFALSRSSRTHDAAPRHARGGFPLRENGLDNAGNSRATGGLTHPNA